MSALGWVLITLAGGFAIIVLWMVCKINRFWRE